MKFWWKIVPLALGLLAGVSGQSEAASKRLPISCEFNRLGGLKHLFVCPNRIDGKMIGGFFGLTEKHINAVYGRHVYSISVDAKASLIEYAVVVSRDVTATLVKGRKYQTVGRMSGRTVTVWIKDTATGQRVSSVAQFELRDCRIGCMPWRRVVE